MNDSHHELVAAFFRQCEDEDPVRYKEICDKYPVLTLDKNKHIHNVEDNVGLLGLQPSRIPVQVAHQYDLESVYDREDETE